MRRINLDDLREILDDKRNKLIIIKGPPLVGKSYLAEILSRERNSKYIKLEGLTHEITLEDIYEEEKEEYWIDADHYLNEDWISIIENIIENLLNRDKRVILILNNELFRELKEKVTKIPNLDHAKKILIKEFSREEALEKIRESLKPLQKNVDIKKLSEQILARDPENFTKAPYIWALGEAAKKFDGTEEHLVAKLIIATYKKLNEKINPKNKPIEDFENIMNIKDIKRAKPEFFKSWGIEAIDIEEGYVADREKEKEVMKHLNTKEKTIIVLVGESATGKSTIARKNAYMCWKKGYPVLYYPQPDYEPVRTKRPPIIILEDIHINPKVLIDAYDNSPPGTKIIATSREEIKPQPGQYTHYVRLSQILRETKQIKLEKEDFKEIVEKLLGKLEEKEEIVIRGNRKRIIAELTERTEESIWHLIFYLRILRRQREISEEAIEKIRREEIWEEIREYYIGKEIPTKIETLLGREIDKRDIELALAYLSIFSKYEIAIPFNKTINFIEMRQPQLEDTIKILLEIREIKEERIKNEAFANPRAIRLPPVSYTHLTLPTN